MRFVSVLFLVAISLITASLNVYADPYADRDDSGITIAYSIEIIDIGSKASAVGTSETIGGSSPYVSAIISEQSILESAGRLSETDFTSENYSHSVLQRLLLITTPGVQAGLSVSVQPLKAGTDPEIFMLSVTPAIIDAASGQITTSVGIVNKGAVSSSLRTEVTALSGERKSVAVLNQNEEAEGTSRQLAIVLTATTLSLGTVFDGYGSDLFTDNWPAPAAADGLPAKSVIFGVDIGYTATRDTPWTLSIASPAYKSSTIQLDYGGYPTGVMCRLGIEDKVNITDNLAVYASYHPIGLSKLSSGIKLINEWTAGIEYNYRSIRCGLQVRSSKLIVKPDLSIFIGYRR